MGSGTSQSHEADVSHPAPETFEGQLLALLPVMRRYSRSIAKSDAEGEDLLQDCVARALAVAASGAASICVGGTHDDDHLYRNGHKSRARTRHETLDAAENVSVAASQTDPFQLQQLKKR
jgi:RNA polymerase sigma-70 factor (ECF subfamily)